jgi:hypothetical protein
MRRVQARLARLGHFPVRDEMTIDSCPGIVIRFVPTAGTLIPTVCDTGTGRIIGRIIGGKIVYVEPSPA